MHICMGLDLLFVAVGRSRPGISVRGSGGALGLNSFRAWPWSVLLSKQRFLSLPPPHTAVCDASGQRLEEESHE
jgi:hypothetical protein